MDFTNYWTSSGTNQSGGGGDPGSEIPQSLRFRPGCYLRRQYGANFTNNPYTVSFWYKIGNPSSKTKRPFQFYNPNNSNYTIPSLETDGTWRFLTRSGNDVKTTSVFRDNGAWAHMLFQPQTNNVWINGELQPMSSNSNITNNISGYYVIQMSQNTGDTGVDYNWQGYMADVRFIDGQYLPPTTFGRFNADGVWVPVDPEFGDTAQVWSDQCYTSPAGELPDLNSTDKDWDASYPIVNGFDGNSASLAAPNGLGEWSIFRPDTPIKNVTSFRTNSLGNQTTDKYLINGVDVTSQVVYSGNDIIFDAAVAGGVDLETFAIRSLPAYRCAWYTMTINGQVLVDGVNHNYGASGFHLTFADPTNVGRDYSGNGNDFDSTGFDTEPYSPIPYTFTGSVGGGYPVSEVPYYNTPFRLPSSYITVPTVGSKWEWSPPLECKSSLGMNFQGRSADYAGTTYRLTFGDGTTQDVPWNNPPQSTTEAYTESISTSATSLSSVEVIAVGGNAQGGWAGLMIDGNKLLYNPNQPGPTYDLMQDSPTNNFATWNPLYKTSYTASDRKGTPSYSDANLTAGAETANQWCVAMSTIKIPPKVYWEVTVNTRYSNYPYIGVMLANKTTQNESKIIQWYSGNITSSYDPSGTDTNPFPTFAVGDTLRVWYDQDQNIFYGAVNGGPTSSLDVGALNSAGSIQPDDDVFIFANNVYWSSAGGRSSTSINFGQQPFKYAVPAGFEPLCTEDLPAPTIPDGRDHFQAITGPGNAAGSIWKESTINANNPTDPLALTTELGPWDSTSTYLADPRDASYTLVLNDTVNSLTFSLPSGFTSDAICYVSEDGTTWRLFDDGGKYRPTTTTAWPQLVNFTVNDGTPIKYLRWMVYVAGGSLNCGIQDPIGQGDLLSAVQSIFPSGLWWIKDRVNANQHQLVDSVRGSNLAITTPAAQPEIAYVAPTGDSVAWCWNYNAANPSINGFDIVQYTGNAVEGSGNTQTVNHNLGTVPDFMIVNNNDESNNSIVYHSALGPTKYIMINTSGAATTSSLYWDDTAPTATNFTVGDRSNVNGNGDDMIAYLWSAIPGYSAFGSYKGNGANDGTFIYTGFRPAFVMIKGASNTNWSIQDSTRYPFNPTAQDLIPNNTASESQVSAMPIDLLSNGFKMRTNNATINTSNATYVYAAFAENPFQSPVTAR